MKPKNESPVVASPADEAVEQCVLGAFILEPATLSLHLADLRESFFYPDSHRLIFRTLCRMVEEGRKVDILTLCHTLQCNGELEEAGGMYYLVELTRKVASSAHIAEHIEILRKKEERRALTLLGQQILQSCADLTVDEDELAARCEEAFDNLRRHQPWHGQVKSIGEILQEAFTQREERVAAADANGVTGIHTGFADLDRLTGGWLPQELIVIGGQTSHGKTALLNWHLLEAARRGWQCLVYSLEMSSVSLAGRMMVSLTDLDPEHWRYHPFTQEEQEQAARARTELEGEGIHLLDESGYHVAELCAIARQHHLQGKCDILFVDYLQLIPSATTGMTRELQVRDISRRLKALAKQLRIPVVVLAQLNRQMFTRADGMPWLSDLRESGSIEQDADKVLLIYRPSKAKLELDPESGYNARNLLVYKLEKHRNGPCGNVYLSHNDSFSRFETYVPPQEELKRLMAEQRKQEELEKLKRKGYELPF